MREASVDQKPYGSLYCTASATIRGGLATGSDHTGCRQSKSAHKPVQADLLTIGCLDSRFLVWVVLP